MIPGNIFPLELRRHSIGSNHILEVIVSRIPIYFLLFQVAMGSPPNVPTQNTVSEKDVSFGVGDLISLFTQ